MSKHWTQKTARDWLIINCFCAGNNHFFIQKLSIIKSNLFMKGFQGVPSWFASSKLGTFTVYETVDKQTLHTTNSRLNNYKTQHNRRVMSRVCYFMLCLFCLGFVMSSVYFGFFCLGSVIVPSLLKWKMWRKVFLTKYFMNQIQPYIA